jgi:XTP/dITP diphosphohydrolase
MEILLATNNQGKIIEIKKLLKDLPIQIRSLREFPEIEDVEEIGTTFTENAVLKAKTYSLKTNLWALADDSGLEVDVLGLAPGVFSARYAGKDANNEEKINKVLNEIEKIDKNQRTARFICVMALTDEKGNVKMISEGICEGNLADKPIGMNGFGYDPIFIPANFQQTFGELSDEIKQSISHRSKAIKKIIDFLRHLT